MLLVCLACYCICLFVSLFVVGHVYLWTASIDPGIGVPPPSPLSYKTPDISRSTPSMWEQLSNQDIIWNKTNMRTSYDIHDACITAWNNIRDACITANGNFSWLQHVTSSQIHSRLPKGVWRPIFVLEFVQALFLFADLSVALSTTANIEGSISFPFYGNFLWPTNFTYYRAYAGLEIGQL